MKSAHRLIQVVRKDGDADHREHCRYMLLGPRCTAAYFHLALQHIFGSSSTSNSLISLLTTLGKPVSFSDLTDNETYFVVFDSISTNIFEESQIIEEEMIDSMLNDASKVKVMLPDGYLMLKIGQMREKTEEIVKELRSRLDFLRVKMGNLREKLRNEVGTASTEFLAYASQVNALNYRKAQVFPVLSEVVTEAKTLISELKSTRMNQIKPVTIANTLARVSPERLPALSITRKMMEEAGLTPQELKRFVRFASRNPSEVVSEAPSLIPSPKAQIGVDLEHSRSLDARSMLSGSDTSGTRERKVLTRLRDKAKASEGVLQTTISAFIYEGETVTRCQLIVVGGYLKVTGLGKRGNRSRSFAMGELESVRRLDEREKTLGVRFGQGQELKIGFPDESTYHNWVGAFEDQLALIRGSLSSPRRTQDGLS